MRDVGFVAPAVVGRHDRPVPIGDDVGDGDARVQLGTGRACGLHQGGVQIAAVGDEVRSAVSGPVLLAEVDLGEHLGGDGVAEDDVLGQYTVGEHLVEDSPGVEDAGAVRPDLQAGADLAELGGPLKHRDLGALPGERQGVGRPADAAAGDDDL